MTTEKLIKKLTLKYLKRLRLSILCYKRNTEKYSFSYWAGDVKIPYQYVLGCFCSLIAKASILNADLNYSCTINSASEYLANKLIWNYKELGDEIFFKWPLENKGCLERLYDADRLRTVDFETSTMMHG